MKVGPDLWITAIRVGCRHYGIIKRAQSQFIGAVFIHRAINQNGDQLHIYKKNGLDDLFYIHKIQVSS
jgi:hypothetical protein